jgi:hypothetical protein
MQALESVTLEPETPETKSAEPEPQEKMAAEPELHEAKAAEPEPQENKVSGSELHEANHYRLIHYSTSVTLGQLVDQHLKQCVKR